MRAVWYEENGPADKVLKVGESPDPEPNRGEVKVRVACSGVNPSDVKRREGWRGQKISFPRIILNNDGSGVIAGVGPDVDAARIGERVWLHSTGYKRAFGTASEFATLPAGNAIVLPKNTSFEEGACLGVPAMTAHRCLFADGPIEGMNVLVTGGAGAVGYYAVQLARWARAKCVVATISGPEKAAVALEAGAHFAIDYRRENVQVRLNEILDGAAVDRVVDVDFGANLPCYVPALAPYAVISTYASMSSPAPTIPFYNLMTRNIVLRWVYVYEIPETAKRQACKDITSWLKNGNASHRIGARFPLDQMALAHELVETGTALGQVVVEVSQM